jgi:spore coat polysaccharide biosynthesis protein SpsF
MRCCVVVQGRLGSSRLPAKLALDLAGAPLLQRVVERVTLAAGVDEILLATSTRPEDDVTARLAERAGIGVFRGSLDDARDRFLRAAASRAADVVIRVTADNPFVEPAYIEELIARKRAEPRRPYIVHDLGRVVHGTASELVDTAALAEAARRVDTPAEREHITPALRSRPDGLTLVPPAALADSELSLSVDTVDDYVAACRLFEAFGGGRSALVRIVEAFRGDPGDPSRFRRRPAGHGT